MRWRRYLIYWNTIPKKIPQENRHGQFFGMICSSSVAEKKAATICQSNQTRLCTLCTVQCTLNIIWDHHWIKSNKRVAHHEIYHEILKHLVTLDLKIWRPKAFKCGLLDHSLNHWVWMAFKVWFKVLRESWISRIVKWSKSTQTICLPSWSRLLLPEWTLTIHNQPFYSNRSIQF